MAETILTSNVLPRKNVVQVCNRAKLAPNELKTQLLHDCTSETLKIVSISSFYLQINIGGLVVVCPSDEFYFSLLDALATGHEVSLSALVKGGLNG